MNSFFSFIIPNFFKSINLQILKKKAQLAETIGIFHASSFGSKKTD